MKRYLFGLATLGVAIGFFVSFSQSPVIATLLPLLFGLIGAASGLILGKPSSDEEKQNQLGVAGVSLATFSLSIVLSAAGGLYLISKEDSATFSDETFDSAIELLALKKFSLALGASPDELTYILASAPKTQHLSMSSRQSIKTYLASVYSEMLQLESSLALLNLDEEEEEWGDITNLQTVIRGLSPLVKQWTQGESDINHETAYKIIETLKHYLSEVISNDSTVELSTIKFLSQHRAVFEHVLNFQAVLYDSRIRWSNDTVASGIDHTLARYSALLEMLSKTNIEPDSALGRFAFDRELFQRAMGMDSNKLM